MDTKGLTQTELIKPYSSAQNGPMSLNVSGHTVWCSLGNINDIIPVQDELFFLFQIYQTMQTFIRVSCVGMSISVRQTTACIIN